MKRTKKFKDYFSYHGCKRWVLLTATLFCIIIGLILGIILRGVNEKWTEINTKSMEKKQWVERDKMYFEFIGNLYIHLIKLVLIPMVISRIVTNIGTISFTFQRKMTLLLVGYFLMTVILASAITISTFLIIKPGEFFPTNTTNTSDDNSLPGSLNKMLPEDIFLDIFRNMIPSNIIVATFNSTKTVLLKTTVENLNLTELKDDRHLDFETRMIEAPNLLGLISYYIVFGAAARYCTRFCDNEAKEKVTVVLRIMMDITGIGSIMVTEILQAKDVYETLVLAAWFILNCLIVFVIHGLIVIPGLFWIITRKNPFRLMKIMGPALVTGLITASTIAANHEMGVCLKVL